MPWRSDLFSAGAREGLTEVPSEWFPAISYFDGIMAGEPEALTRSFTGVPELYDPVRGRVEGVAPFERFVTETAAWLAKANARSELVG